MFFYKKCMVLVTLFFYIANSVALYNDTHRGIANHPLSILFVVGGFPAPSQTFILNIMTGLIDAGHDVSIFAFRRGDKNSMQPNVEKYNLLSRTIYGKVPTNISDYDIVFCQFGNIGKQICDMKHVRKWLKKRKFVVCFRGADISKYTKKNPIFYKNMFKRVDRVLPVCDYFKERLVSLGCSAAKIVVHHSAIDCSKFFFNIKEKPENDTIHLISVSRLVKKKGIDYAIKAIAQVVQKHPNIHFTIVGDGPERNYLESLINKLKLEDKISLYGWASHEEVVSLLQNSHIFLLPSRVGPDGNEEGIPNALKEAMSMGLISVATWHAGNPELIDDGISGFLVPEKSKNKLARAINYIIEHPEEWESIALAGRKKIEDEFETKKSIEKLEAIFYRLCR